MISRESIEELFNQARSATDVPFDVDQECLWTYFLIDSDPELLESVGVALAQEGFTFAGLLEPDMEEVPEGESPSYYLQVSRVEKHTVDSLVELNEWFEEIADFYGIEGYDGMDVGAIEVEDA